jgi:hypothetical protein
MMVHHQYLCTERMGRKVLVGMGLCKLQALSEVVALLIDFGLIIGSYGKF